MTQRLLLPLAIANAVFSGTWSRPLPEPDAGMGVCSGQSVVA